MLLDLAINRKTSFALVFQPSLGVFFLIKKLLESMLDHKLCINNKCKTHWPFGNEQSRLQIYI